MSRSHDSSCSRSVFSGLHSADVTVLAWLGSPGTSAEWPPKQFLVPGLILSLQNYKFCHLSLESETGSKTCDWSNFKINVVQFHFKFVLFVFAKKLLSVDSYHQNRNKIIMLSCIRCIHNLMTVSKDALLHWVNMMAVNSKEGAYCWKDEKWLSFMFGTGRKIQDG